MHSFITALHHKTSPEATFRHFQVGLVIGLGALSLALLSVFGGDLHTKVSQDSLEKIVLMVQKSG